MAPPSKNQTTTWSFDYVPQDRQKLLHETRVQQLFYGGAVGGGKSHAIRNDAIMFCLTNPGMVAYLFRRTLPELQDNHIRQLQQQLAGIATYSVQHHIFTFLNGSILRCCYSQDDNDILKYQGAEIHWLGVDEASLMTPFQLEYIRGRVRLGGFASKVVDKGWLPRIVFTSNPKGPAHAWFKEIFVDKPAMRPFYDATTKDPKDPDHKGMTSIYIPAKMSDNAYLDRNYAGQYAALGPELFRAYTEGDWDAIEGQAFHNLSRHKHLVRPFKIPNHWPIFMSLDWGYATPYSIGYWTVSEGATIPAKPHLGFPDDVYLPPGAVIRFHEIYGYGGKYNMGTREDAPSVARKILEFEKTLHRPVEYRVADYQIWAQSDGPSVLTRMAEASEGRLKFRQGRKDRRANYHEFLTRLSGSPHYLEDGEEGDYPMLFVTSNCHHWWRTVPMLQLDETDMEKGYEQRHVENHAADETGYMLASQPFSRTAKQLYDIELDAMRRARRRLLKGSGDPYSTVGQFHGEG